MKLNIEDVQKSSGNKRTKQITVNVSDGLRKWLTKKGVSPSKLFIKACEELGFEGDVVGDSPDTNGV